MPEYSEEQKRREAHVEFLQTGAGDGEEMYDYFLSYFDEHEPKLALAIREGIPESVPEDVIRYGVNGSSTKYPGKPDEERWIKIARPEGTEQ